MLAQHQVRGSVLRAYDNVCPPDRSDSNQPPECYGMRACPASSPGRTPCTQARTVPLFGQTGATWSTRRAAPRWLRQRGFLRLEATAWWRERNWDPTVSEFVGLKLLQREGLDCNAPIENTMESAPHSRLGAMTDSITLEISHEQDAFNPHFRDFLRARQWKSCSLSTGFSQRGAPA